MLMYINKTSVLDCTSEAPFFHVLMGVVTRLAIQAYAFIKVPTTLIIRRSCKTCRYYRIE